MSEIRPEDFLWLMFSSILVMLMQAGFLCLESGLIRSKNAINVAMKNLADFVLVLLLWWLVAFGMMFGDVGTGWFGRNLFAPEFSELGGWNSAFFLFQSMFAATAVTIVSGAVAERMRFNAYLLLSLVTLVAVYAFVGHWTWGGLLSGHVPWLAAAGFVDFAGSTVVHSAGGWVALAAVLVIGPRLGRFDEGASRGIPASSLPLATLGVMFFVVGWIGFNAGSTLALTEQVAEISLRTLLSGCAGAVSAYILSGWLRPVHTESAVAPLNGILGSLVAITAGCHAVSAQAALFIGAVAGVIVIVGAEVMGRLRIDDAISAVPVHLSCGIWGTLAVGLFGDLSVLGTSLDRAGQIQAQLLGIAAVAAWSFPVSFLLIYGLNRLIPLRVSPDDEMVGLNVSEHQAHTDLIELMEAMRIQKQNRDLTMRLPVEPFTEVGQIAHQQNQLLDELQKAVQQNDAIVNDNHDGILTYLRSGEITSCNPSAANTLGLTPADIVGSTLNDFLIIEPGISEDRDEEIGIDVFYQPGAHTLYVQCRTDGRRYFLDLRVSESSHRHDDYICLLHDRSEARRLEEALYSERERALVTLHSIADGVITCDAVGRVTYLNQRAEELTGWTIEKARGLPMHRIFPVVESPLQRPDQSLAQRVMSELPDTQESKTRYLYHRDGSVRAVRNTVAPIRNRLAEIVGVVAVFQDVTEAQRMERELSYQATHDLLTKLVNRREFERRLQVLIDEQDQQPGGHVLCFIDLDQFKIVNDTCGHAAGDELLRQISSRLKKHLRDSDLLARLGGDEFGAILPHCAVAKGAEIAERMREDVKAFRFTWEGRVFAVGASIGVAEINADIVTLSQALNLADAACYMAKKRGRNRVQLASPGDNLEHSEQMNWVNRIQEALDQDRFRLYAQAIKPARLSEDDGGHVEILLRMIDIDDSEISPGAFIPAAERYHLMDDIDTWVLKNSLQWFGQHGGADCQVRSISINLSGQSVGSESFLTLVQKLLVDHSIEPHRVSFEITETEAIANLERARRFIARLKELGCSFALDDFGSGLSSFGYLKNLDVDYLKIDGVFIKDIQNDSVDYAMVQAINTIGHVMGLKTIAEFVGSEQSLEVMRSLNVDYVQGYHIHVPEPLDNLRPGRGEPVA